MSVSEPNRYRRLIEEVQIEIHHPARSFKQMWRGQNWTVWIRSRRIQWISEQIVIEEILIPAKVPLKVVKRSFLDLESCNVVWIASVAKISQREIVEEEAGVVGGVHVERLF